ncbi:MAG: PQQ-dependent sugar dehydrogenase, partial [Fimbriiglobus sp.]
MRTNTAFFLGIALFGTAGPARGQIQAVAVGGTGTFSSPVFAGSAPGSPGLLYVVEQGGLIRGLDTASGTVSPTPLLNLPGITGASFTNSAGETGLLGMAFHPNFQSNGLMYVQYTYANGSPNHGIRVEQFTVSGGAADAASRRTVIEYSHPDNNNHNAGWIGFNPVNGTTGGNSG